MDKYLAVGRGSVGSVFSTEEHFDLSSHHDWEDQDLSIYSGMVCTAGICNEPTCQNMRMDEVLKANVDLPMRMLRAAKALNIPFVAFSTTAVYGRPGIRSEDDDVNPHNRYTASKIMMEYALLREGNSRLFIFRIPFVVLFTNHPNDFGARVSKWPKCEDVTASIVYRGDLRNAVIRALKCELSGGIYNIASGDVHFPRFLEDRFGWHGQVVPAHSLGKTPNCMISVGKAKEAGLLNGI